VIRVLDEELAEIFPSSQEGREETEKVSQVDEAVAESIVEDATPLLQMHQETRSGHIIAPHGNHAHITINNYYHRVVREAEQWLSEDTENEIDEDMKGTSGTEDKLIAENLRFGRQNIPHFDDNKVHILSDSRTLFKDEVQISDWYYGQLDEYEQCYVQAVAILHGAQAQEIYKRTDALYRVVQAEKHIPIQQATSPQDQSFEATMQEYQSFIFPRKPRLILQKKTSTTTRRVNSAERLFWEDVDSNGQSIFGAHVLTFLSKEFLSKGEHWEHFLATIEDWSIQRGECSWRAARALGVILWHQDVAQLRRQAEAWAKKNTIKGRRQAASLLDGAREIESITQHEVTGESQLSFVLYLLDEWTRRLQEDATKTTISVGCAAANTYGFIGKKSLDIQSALHGVDALLTFKQAEVRSDTRALFAAGVAAYVNLTWAGHLRVVLEYLSAVVEELVHHWQLPKSLQERHSYRLRLETRLNATFEAFFLVTAAVSPKEQSAVPDLYTQPLSEQIAVPDPEKRDIVLVAILTRDPMQISVCRLFCAAIISNSGQSRKLAFELLYQWAEIVIALHNATDPSSKMLYQIFVQFMVELGKTIDEWCRDLARRGYRSLSSYKVYTHKLQQWHEEGKAHKRVIGAFMQEVLRQCKTYPASKKKSEETEIHG
jgi:hypothetical protein